MAEFTKIEWCDHTINFWWGCTKVSPACANCYAEALDARFHSARPKSSSPYAGSGFASAPHWGAHAPRLTRATQARDEAMRYERRAVKEGRRFRVFTNSMSDFFEDRADLVEARQEALDIIMATPHLDWLILTKRPEQIMDLLQCALERAWVHGPEPFYRWLWAWKHQGTAPANVWLGTTVEDQERADQRIPALLRVPAAVRFLSCEPLLGLVDLGLLAASSEVQRQRLLSMPLPLGIVDWVICGGESGHHARPMHPDWARGLRDQCAMAGVPFLFKQWGEWGASHEHMATGEPRFCVFQDFNHWVNKASTWMRKGDLLLDANGVVLHCGFDIRHGKEPFTALRKVGKSAAGRLLDGVEYNGFPQLTNSSA